MPQHFRGGNGSEGNAKIMLDRYDKAARRRQNMKRRMGKIVFLCLLIGLFYAVREAVGVELFDGFWFVLFEPWIEFTDKWIAPNWGTIITHPITLIVVGLFLLRIIFA